MADTQNSHHALTGHGQPASATRLRSLARSSFDLRTFLRTISAVEIAAIVGLLGLVVAVFVVYFAWILPDQVRRLQLSNEVAANTTKIETLSAEVADPTRVTHEYQLVHESLDTFRGQTLQPRTAGRLQIINLVNDLTRETHVALTGPISFEAKNPLIQELEKPAGKSKLRAAEGEVRTYPSLNMSMSISGSYPQIRAFLAKFETSRQFAIIESVSISSNEDDDDEGNSGRRSSARVDTGAITLDISMTAYFQPDVSTSTSTRTVASLEGGR